MRYPQGLQQPVRPGQRGGYPAVVVRRRLEALTGRFGSAVLGGVLRIATQLEADGTIRVLTPEFDVELGELDGSPNARVDRPSASASSQVVAPGSFGNICLPNGPYCVPDYYVD